MMRTAYHSQLSTLSAELSTLCDETAHAMRAATEALLGADLDQAERVIGDRGRIASASAEAWQAAFDLLALQQPVAADLRAVVSAIHVASDLERMNTLAVHIAELALPRHPKCAVPEEVKECFADMGRVAVQMASTARDVLTSGDAAMAARLSEDDDVMDDLHRHLLSVLFDHHWPHVVAATVDVMLLGRFYERFADHAVEIGRRIVFEATGALLVAQAISTY
jgi:phosphate transport system protein